jgi:hypothetical protein
MAIRKTEISELPLAQSLIGLFTIGVDALNRSVKVGLEFLKVAADNANYAATKALQAAQNANFADLYNVTQKVPLQSGYYTPATARAAVPADIRKKGLVINYQTADKWVMEQYIGSTTDGWTDSANWKAFDSEIIDLGTIGAGVVLDPIIKPGLYKYKIHEGRIGSMTDITGFLFVTEKSIDGTGTTITQNKIEGSEVASRNKTKEEETILEWNEIEWSEWKALGASGATVERNSSNGSIIISGYVDALPPRPVKGDCYVIKPKEKRHEVFQDSYYYCYEGIYYLNRNNKKETYAGDNDAEFDGNAIETGLIELSEDRRLVVWGKSTLDTASGINGDIFKLFYYNESKVKTGESGNFSGLSKITVPDGVKYIRVIYTIGNNNYRLKFLRVYQVNTDIRPGIVYRFNGTQWERKPIPQGSLLPTKDGYFILKFNPVSQAYVPELNVRIPKIQIQSTRFVPDTNSNRWDRIQIVNKSEVFLQAYILKTFVRKKFQSRRKKTSYYEIKNKREYHVGNSRIPQNETAFNESRSMTRGTHNYLFPVSWQALFFTVFSSITDMTGSKSRIRDEWVASTGIRKRILTEDGIYYTSNKADFAFCLSKKVKGKWIDGEMTYFSMYAGNKTSSMDTDEIRKITVEVTG